MVENGHIKGEMKSEGGQVTSSDVEGDERKGERTKAHSVDDIDTGGVAQITKEKECQGQQILRHASHQSFPARPKC